MQNSQQTRRATFSTTNTKESVSVIVYTRDRYTPSHSTVMLHDTTTMKQQS